MPDLSDRSRCRVVVSGRVQNVWFRNSCGRLAEARGLAGWVRNRPDGKVEAAFEGPPAAVEALVTWCATGPPRARVVRVERFEELPTGESGFAIR